jgi:hypothetical protein
VEESLGKESLLISEDDMMGEDRDVEVVDYDSGDDG